jgi:hypothetical protein
MLRASPVRALTILSLLVAATAARAGPASAPADQGAPARAAAEGDPGEAAAPAGDAPALPARADTDAHDEDFEPETGRPSIALGPTRRGSALAWLELGWLRSGVRAELGLGASVGIFVAADTFLLYEGFRGPSGVHFGLRVSPFDGPFRASAELSLGEIFSPRAVSSANVTALRLGGAVGLVTDWATVYTRASLHGYASAFGSDAGWTRDEEFGLGVERALLGRLVVGAEAYLWSRPGLSTLGEWTVRIGYAR